jgi:hypothetical protein
MSEHDSSDPQCIDDAVHGFGQLEARQVTIHEWRVLSYRNGGITAHEVNIDELTCTCMDMAMQKRDAQVCDHVAVALHHAKRQMDVQSALKHQMLQQMLELEEHVRAIERRAAGVSADAEQAKANGHSDTQSERSDTFDGDPVDQMQAILESAGLDHTAFDVRVDESTGRLEVLKDGYIDDFSAWVDLSDELDLQYVEAGGEDINYLERDRFSEVLS